MSNEKFGCCGLMPLAWLGELVVKQGLCEGSYFGIAPGRALGKLKWV